LNRAAKRNAVNADMADELYAAFREFDADNQAEVAILTANGW
jgi:enoyl-CoA hydratase/carnithine racemase